MFTHKNVVTLKPGYIIGIFSIAVILMWGATAWLRLLSMGVPALQLTATALFGAAATSWLLPGRLGRLQNANNRHPWYVWLTVIVGLVGSSGFFFAALHYAPAAQVVVITYSWPLLFAITSDVYSGRRPSTPTLAGLLFGFAGVYVMQDASAGMPDTAWLGYAYGLASGLCWVSYSLLFQIYNRPVAGAYPAFFLVAAITALGLQTVTGSLVWPDSALAWAASIVMGIGPYGLGFMAWGYIVRHGNPHVVPILPYAVPVVAAIGLVLSGHSQPSVSLLTGCALVVAACVAVTFFQQPSQVI